MIRREVSNQICIGHIKYLKLLINLPQVRAMVVLVQYAEVTIGTMRGNGNACDGVIVTVATTVALLALTTLLRSQSHRFDTTLVG